MKIAARPNAMALHNFHVNMLAGFYHGLREMDDETRECLQPLLYNNEKKILVLISAVKTAKSLENIAKAINKEGLQDKVHYLALYKLIAEGKENYLCDLSGSFAQENGIRFDSKFSPNHDETIIPIDEQSFFPLVVKDDLIEIKKAGADISKDFFETYSGKNVVSLHRKSFFFNNTPLRHHGIFVDVSKLLGSDIFIKKLVSKIDVLTKAPACIIYPPHEQGEKLVNKIIEILSNIFQLKPIIFCFADIEIEPENKRFTIYEYLKNLTTDDLILIVDDVSITGNRLHTYQRILHNRFFGKIYYLVGVARPESEQDWERRRKILQVTKNYLLDFVEKVILPNWDSTTCPWCQEKNILKEITDAENYKSLSVTRQLELRLNELNQAENAGLINNVFFSIRNTVKPTFIGGSIFCNKSDASEADLVASIASTIEHLRNGYTNKNDGKFYHLAAQHPLYAIIHPDDYLKGNEKLFEPLIKAGLIRCCLHKELYATEDKNRQKQKKYILNFLRGLYLSNSDKSFFIYELYLSMKMGKLPKPAIEENLRHILENFFKNDKLL